MSGLAGAFRLTIAVSLLCWTPLTAGAQLGKLAQMVKDKRSGDQADVARATATLEWTIETAWDSSTIPLGRRDADGVAVPSRRVITGKATGTMELAPQALPGGPFARRANASAGRAAGYMLSFTPQNGIGERVALSGTTRGEWKIAEKGKCEGSRGAIGQEFASNPGTWTGADQVTVDLNNARLSIGFEGDAPAFVTFGGPVLTLRGPARFACTGKTAPFAVPPTRDQDVSTEPITLSIEAGSPLGGTAGIQRTRNGTVQTLIARTAKRESDGAQTLTTTKLTWDAPPAKGGDMREADTPKLENGQGSVTFTHNGKTATWPLSQAANINQMGLSGVTLLFSGDGSPNDEHGVFTLAVMNMMGQTVSSVSITKGPAGDGSWENEQCTVRSTTTNGRTEGSGECRDGGQVVKLTFSAVR